MYGGTVASQIGGQPFISFSSLSDTRTLAWTSFDVHIHSTIICNITDWRHQKEVHLVAHPLRGKNDVALLCLTPDGLKGCIARGPERSPPSTIAQFRPLHAACFAVSGRLSRLYPRGCDVIILSPPCLVWTVDVPLLLNSSLRFMSCRLSPNYQLNVPYLVERGVFLPESFFLRNFQYITTVLVYVIRVVSNSLINIYPWAPMSAFATRKKWIMAFHSNFFTFGI